MVVVRLHCGGGWGGAWDTIGLIFSSTYAYMFFLVNLVKKGQQQLEFLQKILWWVCGVVVCWDGWGGGMLGVG